MDLNNSTTPEAEKDLAQTPPWFVDAAERALNVKFDLDVCCLSTTAKVSAYYSLAEHGANGLILPWSKNNWCNPPYSDVLPWIGKAIDTAEKGNTSYLLIPDKPDVGFYRMARECADTIIHMPFRLNFIRPDGTPFLDNSGKPSGPKFPVCLILFTPHGLNMKVRDEYIDFRKWRKNDN